jgi:hypothetical protein
MKLNGVTERIRVIISDEMKEDMLICKEDLKTFKVIPRGFPHEVVRQVTKTDLGNILNEFQDVVNDELGSAPMRTPSPMKIKLTRDVIPKRVNIARRVPLRYAKAAKDVMSDLMKKKVITRVEEPTDWCSPAFFVPKGNGKVRLVTDYTELNKFVKRPIHPFPSTRDILQAIPSEARVFAKMDAVHGYFQLGMDTESSYLTTFLVPEGRFRYLRAPMGLNASSDEWCYHSDTIITGLDWAMKIVDDIIIWAKNEEELMERLKIVLERCREKGVRISKKKFEIGEEITFAGHVISGSKGIRPDDEKFEAIKNFPRPKNIKDLRSFMGLVQQLGAFIPDLAHMTSQLRPLMKKNNAWLWLEHHENEFMKIKDLLTSTAMVKPFDVNKHTALLTDASRLHGIGFALLQFDHEGKISMIQCGSSSLNETQQRYATIELECMAIVYAVQKCAYYLQGTPEFEVWTDHRPLVGIFGKDLHTLDNPRLMRMRERLTGFNLKVKWVEGKTHYIADALSRAPVFGPMENIEDTENVVNCSQVIADPGINSIVHWVDDEYRAMISAFSGEIEKAMEDSTHPANILKSVADRISVYNHGEEKLLLLDGQKLVVPKGARKGILEALHKSHRGLTITYSTARQLYYWPGMKNDIAENIKRCEACMQHQKNNIRQEILPTRPSEAGEPMKMMGTDLFDAIGKKWIVLVDRFSGYCFVKQLQKTATKDVVNFLTNIFQDYGWPNSIRSDGGPQFRGDFQKFCRENNITHELSSPYNPESNGLAEAAVKSMKNLMIRTAEARESFTDALAQWRCMTREDGTSPAQLFFKRKPRRPGLPAMSEHEIPIGMEKRDKIYMRCVQGRNKHTNKGESRSIGQQVRIQDPHTKAWDEIGTIKGIRPKGRSFNIQTHSGKELLRGAKHIKTANRFEILEETCANISINMNTDFLSTTNTDSTIPLRPLLAPNSTLPSLEKESLDEVGYDPTEQLRRSFRNRIRERIDELSLVEDGDRRIVVLYNILRNSCNLSAKAENSRREELARAVNTIANGWAAEYLQHPSSSGILGCEQQRRDPHPRDVREYGRSLGDLGLYHSHHRGCDLERPEGPEREGQEQGQGAGRQGLATETAGPRPGVQGRRNKRKGKRFNPLDRPQPRRPIPGGPDGAQALARRDGQRGSMGRAGGSPPSPTRRYVMGLRLFDETHREDRWPQREETRCGVEYDAFIRIVPAGRAENRSEFKLIGTIDESLQGRGGAVSTRKGRGGRQGKFLQRQDRCSSLTNSNSSEERAHINVSSSWTEHRSSRDGPAKAGRGACLSTLALNFSSNVAVHLEAERGSEGPTRIYGGEELTMVLPDHHVTEDDDELSDGWDYTDVARQVAVVEPQPQQVPVIVGRRPATVTWPEDRPSVLVDMREVVEVDNTSDDDIPSLAPDSEPDSPEPETSPVTPSAEQDPAPRYTPPPAYEDLEPGCQTPTEIRSGMDQDLTPGDTDDEEYLPPTRVHVGADELAEALSRIRARYPDSPESSVESCDKVTEL